MPDLSTIAIEKQKHPTLSAESPFNIDYLYARQPNDKYSGDIHYALQLGIQLTGAMEIVYDDFSRICRPGDFGPAGHLSCMVVQRSPCVFQNTNL